MIFLNEEILHLTYGTIYTKNHTKKLAGIGEPMVPTFGGLANIDPIDYVKRK
jgi:hypothetical protein